MLGLGMAPGAARSGRLAARPPSAGQMRTSPLGVWNFAATMPGVPLGATQSTFTSSSGCSTGWPSHSETRAGSPAISRHSRETLPVAPTLGWFGRVDVPLDEERQLRVGLQALDAELLPEQLGAVGAVPVAVDGLAAEAVLERLDVVDRDDPAEPAAAELGAGAHGLAERCLVRGGVVEDLDDLEVGAVGQGQDRVAGAEAGVDATADELLAQQGREALRSCPRVRPGRQRRRCDRDAWLILTRAGSASRHRGRGSAARPSEVSAGAAATRGAARAPSASAGGPRTSPPARRTPAWPISAISSVALET